MDVTNHEEHRKQILSKLNSYFDVVLENIEQQPRSGSRDALSALISCFNATVELMQKAKDDESFMQASKFYHELIDKEFFNKIYQSNPMNKLDELKEKQFASAQENEESPKDKPFDIKAHLVGDVNELPEQVKLELAKVLKALGLPQSEINKNLNL